jgi:hypothetical protein
MFRQFVKLFNTVFGRYDLKLVRANEYKFTESILEVMADSSIDTKSASAEGIVFSMDRAIQIHALLESYYENVVNPPPLHLFYRTSNAQHQKSYDEIIEEYSGRLASVTIQAPFRDKLLDIISGIKAEKMFFLVDDDVYIEKMDYSEFLQFDTKCFVPSIRLGLNLNRCYTSQVDQPLPKFYTLPNIPDRWLTWKLDEGPYDWGYIFSIDGNIFTTKEIEVMSNLLDFKYPNTYEGALGKFYRVFSKRWGVAAKKSGIVNIPCNMVQTECNNVHGNLHQDVLLQKWQQGFKMDWRKFMGFANISAHQDLPMEFIKR